MEFDLKEIDLNKMLGTIKKPLEPLGKPGTLSIIMIVKNEIANIEKAIKSFLPIADEIIVHDTGSTDGTQEVLQKLGVKWFQGHWEGDFSAARNASLDKATSSWVLWMDADDRIPEDQYDNFRKLKTAPLDRIFGFQVINTQAGRPLGTRFMQLRMFPRHQKMRFERKIHEQIVFNAARLGLHAIYTETTIWHTGYESQEIKKQKAQRNLDLSLKEPELIGLDPAFTSCMGDSYFILEEWEKGLAAYKSAYAIPRLKEINRDIWALLPQHIGQGYLRLGQYVQAQEWLHKACEQAPEALEPTYHLADCLRAQGKKQEALQLYLQVLKMPLKHSSTGVQWDALRMYSYHAAALLLLAEGDLEEAQPLLKSMTQDYPQVIEGWVFLSRCLDALGLHEEAAKALQEARLLGVEKMPEMLRPEFVTLGIKKRKILNTKNAILPGLSLCMIVRNEEKNLAACLQEVRVICNEVNIVDTGSTDGTVALARQMGARMEHFPWVEDFSAARNVSLDMARYSWVLWLDADDRVTPEVCKKIQTLISGPAERAYGFVVKSSSDEGKTGSAFRQIRLFPNRPEHRFVFPVHEQILPSLEKSGTPIYYENIEIIHTGYAEADIARNKQIRNRDILQKIVAGDLFNGQKVKTTPVILYTLAHAHFDLGNCSKAVEFFVKAAELAEATHTDPHVLEIAPVKVAAALANGGDLVGAEGAIQIAFTKTSIHPEAWLVGGQVFAALGKVDQAMYAYESLLMLEEHVTFIPVNYAHLRLKALEFLGKYWNKQGKADLALELLKKALEQYKGGAFSTHWIKEVYTKYGLSLARKAMPIFTSDPHSITVAYKNGAL